MNNVTSNCNLHIRIDGTVLEGWLVLPEDASTIVIFAHGSGSNRFSPRNNFVAEYLNHKNIGTLLIDLATKQEDMVYANRFNTDLLTMRLCDITEWMMAQSEFRRMNIAYFGASTGAACALNAAALFKERILAVVSRGGRTDIAHDSLPLVKSPTLLVVGALDIDVINLNREAFKLMKCEKRMEIVEDASHLFEESGKLKIVAKLAADWYKKHELQQYRKE